MLFVIFYTNDITSKSDFWIISLGSCNIWGTNICVGDNSSLYFALDMNIFPLATFAIFHFFQLFPLVCGCWKISFMVKDSGWFPYSPIGQAAMFFTLGEEVAVELWLIFGWCQLQMDFWWVWMSQRSTNPFWSYQI